MEQLRLLAATALIIGLAACSGMMEVVECRVEDPKLEALIRETLNLTLSDEIDCAALAEVTVLEGSSRGIERLGGLEYAVGLTKLALSQNQIEDLRPIEALTGLHELYLYGNRISDLSPLSGLTELRQLHLNGNVIQSLSPLQELSQLQVLSVAGNRIRSLAPISSLTELRALDAGANDLIDSQPLTRLVKLEQLYLDLNQITDITPFLNNSGLRAAKLISIRRNCLDLREGTEASTVIQELSKSVETVRFEPQRECTTASARL